MPYTAAELALLDAPLPSPHLPRRDIVRLPQSQRPFGTRRITDPRLEAEIARSFSRRLGWEEDGYVFPDHPRPPVPRLLRRLYPAWAAEDDAAGSLRLGGLVEPGPAGLVG